MNINSNPNIEKIVCPFCSSTKAIQYRNVGDIVKCLSCGTVYLRTRYTQNILNQVYQRYEDNGSHLTPPEDVSNAKTTPLRREFLMSEILEYIQPKGHLLDIGCGWGAFLDNARDKGFDVSGIEITQKGVD